MREASRSRPRPQGRDFGRFVPWRNPQSSNASRSKHSDMPRNQSGERYSTPASEQLSDERAESAKWVREYGRDRVDAVLELY